MNLKINLKNLNSTGKLKLTYLAIIIAVAFSLVFFLALTLSASLEGNLVAEPIPEQITSVNTSLELDLSDYFLSEHRLWFSCFKTENFIIMFGNSIAEPGRFYRSPSVTLFPLRNWQGEEEIEFKATDGRNSVGEFVRVRVV